MKCLLLSSDFIKKWNMMAIFVVVKLSNVKCNENIFSGSQAVTCRQTD
jgi:hypothetical protein